MHAVSHPPAPCVTPFFIKIFFVAPNGSAFSFRNALHETRETDDLLMIYDWNGSILDLYTANTGGAVTSSPTPIRRGYRRSGGSLFTKEAVYHARSLIKNLAESRPTTEQRPLSFFFFLQNFLILAFAFAQLEKQTV